MKEERRTPKRFENPVTLPSAVFEGLEAVQGLGLASMADPQAVRDIGLAWVTETAA